MVTAGVRADRMPIFRSIAQFQATTGDSAFDDSLKNINIAAGSRLTVFILVYLKFILALPKRMAILFILFGTIYLNGNDIFRYAWRQRGGSARL